MTTNQGWVGEIFKFVLQSRISVIFVSYLYYFSLSIVYVTCALHLFLVLRLSRFLSHFARRFPFFIFCPIFSNSCIFVCYFLFRLVFLYLIRASFVCLLLSVSFYFTLSGSFRVLFSIPFASNRDVFLSVFTFSFFHLLYVVFLFLSSLIVLIFSFI